MVSSNQKRFQSVTAGDERAARLSPKREPRPRGRGLGNSHLAMYEGLFVTGAPFRKFTGAPKVPHGTSLSVLVGRHGAMNPTGRVRCPGARLIQKDETTACLSRRSYGTSCCGIFATLGEYFCPITLLGDFPVRMSQLEHVGGRAHGCRDDSIDCDSGVRCRFCAGPLGHQARPLRRCEIEEGE